MDLDELSTLSDTFEEDELVALNALPRNQDGLLKLLGHLRSYDSMQAWIFLFDEFLPVLTDEQFQSLKDQAKSVWGADGLPVMWPNVFPASDEFTI